jgi:hypothetical protein
LHKAKLPTYKHAVLQFLAGVIEAKTGREVRQSGLFLHYKAPATQKIATHNKLSYLSYQCIDGSRCSPDLTMWG